MIRQRISSLFLSLGVLAVPATGLSQTFNDPGFVSELVTSVAAFTPVGLAWAPDGRMFIWTKNGIVRVFKNGVLLSTPFINLSSEVNTFDDHGMLGLTLHPDFASNGYVYLSYVYEDGGNPNDSTPKTNRVVRVTANPANPDVALPGSYTVILGSIGIPPCSNYAPGSDCIPADGGSHTIGSVRFGPDGKLLVSIGDGSDGDFRSLRAQHLDEWSGKIIRVNADGTAPGDNPFDDGTQSIRSKVWAYGVRNPFRFSVEPGTNTLFFGDVGWNTWEEFDKGQPGANFGWPCYEGSLPQSFFGGFTECQTLPAAAVTQPILTYGRSVGAAAIGGTVYTGDVYPEVYRGSYFFADYVGGWIRRAVFDGDGNPTAFPYFATDVPAPVTIELGPDGNLYYISFSTGQIRRIRYNGPSAVASASPTSGYSPLAVSFSSAGSINPTGQSLTYSWDFGDGGTSTVANPSHTYVNAGVASYLATLTVRTPTNATSSATVKVTVGSRPPTATIVSPAGGTQLTAGQTVVYQGQATDPEDGPLTGNDLRWTILLHHNTHIHTSLSGSGPQGSFEVEDHGLGSYSYEIVLEATDSSGLTSTTSVVLPVTADTVPPAAPTGFNATATGSARIDLGWTASTDNGVVIGYQIERCQGAGCGTFAPVVTTAATTFSDTGLSASTTYRYRVRAVDASGNLGAYSNVATATTLAADTTAPSAPGGLTAAAATSAQVDLTWGAATDNVAVTGYRVERCTGATCTTFAEIAAPTGLTYSDGDRTASTTYRYQVRAVDAAGNVGPYTGIATVTTPTGPAVSPGLVAAYGFNEGSGTTVEDASGNGNTGTLSGALWTAQGKYASGLSFNGGSSLVVIPATASLNVGSGMTLEAWIYPTATQSGWRTIMQREVDAYFLNASTDAGPLRPGGGATINGGVRTIMGPTASPVNGWTHVAMTYDGSSLTLYVNGAAVGSQAATGAVQSTANALRIGGNVPYGEFFTGIIDEVRVYNRALTAPEIQTDMATPLEGGGGSGDTTAPTAPGGVAATAPTSTQVDLSWTAASDNVGVTGYRVERCTGATCTTFAEIATPTGLTYSDGSRAASTTYRYQVRAVDAAGNLGPYSAIATVTTPAAPDTTAPTAPGSLTATASTSTQVSLSWTAATDNVGVTGYRVERCTGAGCTTFAQIASPTGLTYSDGGGAASTTYRYQVRAVDAAGNLGPYSAIATVTTPAAPDTTAPTAPGSLTATASTSTQVSLSWTAATDNVGVTGYRVERCTGAGCTTFAQIASPTGLTYSDGGGAASTTYRYQVRAVDAAGNLGPYSAIATVTTPAAPDTTAPTAPGSLTATASTSTQVSLSWTAATDNVGVTGYRVERCTGAGCTTFAQIGTPTGLTYNDGGRVALTTYRYQVRAVDAAGNLGPYSAIATVTTPDTTAPTAPGALTATAATSTQVNLSWTASTDNVGVTGYRVQRCTGAGCTNFAQIATPTGLTYSDGGRTASTTYRYRVRAVDAAANLSPWSAIATVTTPAAPDTTAPTAPGSLTATAPTSTQVDLSWTAATDNVGVTGYRVERCTGVGCTTFSQIATPTGLTYSDGGLTVGTTFQYQVRAVDAAGNLGPYTPVVTVTTPAPDTMAPSAPGSLTATPATSTEVDLTWGAATDNVAVTGYRVERCTGAACTTFAEIATPTGLTYNDGGPTAETTYRYQVRAVDAAGNLGPYAGIATATTPAGPAVPPGLVAAYGFNEGSGSTVADVSGNGNTGTISGATWTTQGKYASALSFNGASSLVVIAGAASLNLGSGMTLEAWIYPTATQSGWRTILQREVDAYFLNASTDAGPLRPGGGATINGGVGTVAGPTASPIGSWTHVAMTFDGSTLTLYVNGTAVASQAAAGVVQSTPNALRIGGNVPYGEFFTGMIDEVRVYNRALTAGEIQTDMTTPLQ